MFDARRLRRVYAQLLSYYGPQDWWPADTPFEVMVGAILTQNTAWSNVEKALASLIRENLLEAEVIIAAPQPRLAACLRPSGYFNIKAKRLQSYCHWYLQSGGFDALNTRETADLRRALLSVNGIGPETADDILLYAFERPVFVIDAYTRRIFARLEMIAGDESYEELRAMFEEALGPDVTLFNEYHALIVAHAKEACRPRPLCETCCLSRGCAYTP
ncbi:MAG: endonuclease III domain-containing protein [Pseudomonadota bacterium]